VSAARGTYSHETAADQAPKSVKIQIIVLTRDSNSSQGSLASLGIQNSYRSSSMISSSAWREGRVNSCGILASDVSVRLSCSMKLGAVVFT
jgi:hypothetical protein